MLVVVFGAGASYDSNPAVPTTREHRDRPPLANQLFEMDRDATRQAADVFRRAAPAMMAARADVRAGGTVEATLARLQEEAVNDPRARTQLMAVRFYLQRVLHLIPEAWDAHAVRQTSYVSMLDQLARWQRDTGEGLCLITFNYDVLLERACTIVFGHSYATMDGYQDSELVHVYKPHGSVDWAQPALWAGPSYSNAENARRAICDQPDLQLIKDDLRVRPVDAEPIGFRSENFDRIQLAWVPALAIPVERKPAMVMPLQHRRNLEQDLGQATAMLCVGWRAREDHFLRTLQDHLPKTPIPVWSISGDGGSAMETIENVWPTGRFDRYGAIGSGFSRFADPEPSGDGKPPPAQEPVLGHVLRGVVSTTMRPAGEGIDDSPPRTNSNHTHRPYKPLG